MKKYILFLLLGLCMVVSAFSQGFSTISDLTPVPISTNTGEKPQSKVWAYEGKHWAVLPNSSGTHLYRLDGTTWTNVLRLSTRTSSKADCKLNGNDAHILLFQGASSQFVSVEYNHSTGSYQLWSKRTSTVGLNFRTNTETATIDMDGTGRMWLAYDAAPEVHVRYSDSPYHTWSDPITLANNIANDDISAVVAMPGKIGVFWSNQNTKRFGFRTHTDGASPTSWSADEIPASQSALNIGGGMADDHMNLAVASDGTLYSAVKTEYNTTGYPDIALLVRRPNGTWDDLYEVAQRGTRPIVVLNEDQKKIRVVYTDRNGGGNIEYNESSTEKIAFGPQLRLMSSSVLNNSTGAKDNFTTDVVILASSTTHAAGVLATDGTPPSGLQPPTLDSPPNLYTNVPVNPRLEWIQSSGAETYHVQVSNKEDFSSLFYEKNGVTDLWVNLSGLENNTTYYWKVRASNSKETSDWSGVWRFTTKAAPSGTPLVAHWKLDEGSGTTLKDESEYTNIATIRGNPTWIDGVKGKALRFNGSNQFATVPDNASLDLSESLTIATWIKPEKTATQYLIKKAESPIDGYELSLASNGKVFFRFNQETSGNTYRLNSSTSYPANGNTWMHVAIIYDGATLRMYIDGKEDSRQSYSSPPPVNMNDLELTIGSGFDGYRGLQGAMDDIHIYNTALSSAEIAALAAIEGEEPTAPVTPILTSPENQAKGVSTNPTLVWNTSTGAETYQAQVSTSQNFSSLIFDQSGITSSSVNVSGLSHTTTYYWRVRATNAAGNSEWSSIWSFITGNEPIGGDLVANWKMDEGSGTIVDDASENKNHASTSGGPTWIDGVKGKALRFNGSNQYAIAPNHASLNLTQSLTIAAWIKPEKTATQYLIKKAIQGSVDGYELSLASNGRVFFRFNQNMSGDTYRLNSQVSYPSNGNTWMHVAATFDGSTMRLYIDGVENSSTTFSSPPPINTNTLALALGAEANGFRGLQGAMDEVYIFNRALSSAEVKELASIGEPSTPITPILASPENNESGVSTSPTLTWSASDGAVTYQAQVSTSVNFSGTVLNQTDITQTFVELNDLQNETTYYWRVRATNEAGNSDWSSTWNFTTTPAAPAPAEPPVLSSPANNSTNISTAPELSWSNSDGAVSYQAQISTSANFSETVFDQTDIAQTFVELNDLQNETTYYWRVRATNEAGNSDWSSTWNFTTTPAAPAPAEPPVLSSPANNSTNISTAPELSWSNSDGAVSYQAQISTSANFSETVFDQTDIAQTFVELNDLQNETTYYWRVRATNEAGNSDWSSTWNFTTTPAAPAPAEPPVLSSPANSSTNISTAPELSWRASDGAVTYQAQVSTSVNFSQTVFDQTDIAQTFVELNDLQNETTYYWRVRATNEAGNSDWSSTWNFTTTPAAPAPAEPPVLSSPANSSTNISTAPELSWRASDGAVTYQAQVSTSVNFSQTVFDQTDIAQTFVELNDLQNETTYYWRVRATNEAGNSDWSSTWNFTTTPAAPAPAEPPVLSSPANSSTNISTAPELSWRASDGAVTYQAQVSTSVNFSQTVFDQTDIAQTFVELNDLQNETTYYWRVRATNEAGNSDWSSTWNFTTTPAAPAPAEPPVLSSPANNSTNISTAPELSWSASDGAESYQAQVSTSANFSETVFDQTDIVQTFIELKDLQNETTYYWRVRATNAAGNSEWSSTWNFTTVKISRIGQLVAHWQLDEGSGTTLNDASGFNNTGIITGSSTWVQGVKELAIRLNGSGQFATAANDPSLNVSEEITIALWVRPEKRGVQSLLNKADFGARSGYELSLANNGRVSFQINHNSSRVTSQASYPTNGRTWMHIAVTYDGSTLKLFIDGVENSSNSLSSSPLIGTNDLPLIIGAEQGGVNSLMGALDDIMIYNSALSPSQIGEIAGAVSGASLRVAPSELTEPKEKEIEAELLAFPNPFATKATVTFTFPEESAYSLTLYDSKGTTVTQLTQGEAKANEKNTFEIDGAGLPAGIYLLRLQTRQGKTKTLRLVLTK
ncbi:T9SS type A sorting domain-containing protein [Litoribacter ruber]|uniref:LamG-like jellyroll fold domain-containing protein n=1 Tax=Litoribacter ruber TaxID=702568 RepID=UPI001BDAFA99|nr:LamG-like jellyroll fold domain-containing protein [Litoribacter ruber]MBT0812302.1 T9SS type A sorting domain-containing protein [Litoribacter ruber]